VAAGLHGEVAGTSYMIIFGLRLAKAGLLLRRTLLPLYEGWGVGRGCSGSAGGVGGLRLELPFEDGAARLCDGSGGLIYDLAALFEDLLLGRAFLGSHHCLWEGWCQRAGCVRERGHLLQGVDLGVEAGHILSTWGLTGRWVGCPLDRYFREGWCLDHQG
jgi:hypothetical protein